MTFHAKRFGRAASTYGAHAEIQARMAESLIGALPKFGDTLNLSAPRILEMGCGTGLLTRQLCSTLPTVSILATDASSAMLDEARRILSDSTIASPKVSFSVLDASGLGDENDSVSAATPFGMAASNALVQWFPDLENHFRLVAKVLIPQGVYLVSGFSPDNFPELNALLKEPPFKYREFPGHGRERVDQAAAKVGFQLESWTEEAIETIYPSPEAFLASISGLGSSRRPGAVPLTQSRLVYLVDRYRASYSCLGGIKATWKPWYARLRKIY